MLAGLSLSGGCDSSSTPSLSGLGGSTLPNGPIRDSLEHGWIVEQSHDGLVFTDGLEHLEVEGDQAAVIESVAAAGYGYQQLGAMIAGPDRPEGGNIQRLDGYPPANENLGPLVPAEGAVLEPGPTAGGTGDYELLIGMEVTSDELGLRRVVQIIYSVDGVRYQELIPACIILCPASTTLEGCQHESGIGPAT